VYPDTSFPYRANARTNPPIIASPPDAKFAAAPLVNLGVGLEMLEGVVAFDSDGVVTGLATVTGVAVTMGVV
jgi:hypothetical protein